MPFAFHNLRSSTPFITFVVAFAVFTDQFLFAAILPIAPFALQSQVPADQIQRWIAILMGLFGAGVFLSSIPWGWYTDRHTSRRLPFLVGLFILLIATVLLWIAPRLHDASIPLQVVARLLQGFASTVVWTTGLAVLVDAVGQEKIGEASGWVGVALNVGSVTGPMVGGVVFKEAGYDAVFAVILGVVGVDILLRVVMKERKCGKGVKGDVEFDMMKGGLEAGVKEEGKAVVEVRIVGSTNSSQDALIKITPTAEAETTVKLPGFVRLMFSTRFMVALWGVTMLAATFSGIETILPLTVKDIFDWDSMGGGLIFLPLSLPALLGPLVGKVTDRFGGGRWFAAGGFLVLCPALTALRFVEANTTSHKVMLCVLLVVVGSCLTTILEPLFAEVTARATQLKEVEIEMDGGDASNHSGYYAQAYAHFNMAWALGNILGPLVAGFVVEAADWKTATWVMGLVCGLSAVPVLLWCNGFILQRKR